MEKAGSREAGGSRRPEDGEGRRRQGAGQGEEGLRVVGGGSEPSGRAAAASNAAAEAQRCGKTNGNPTTEGRSDQIGRTRREREEEGIFEDTASVACDIFVSRLSYNKCNSLNLLNSLFMYLFDHPFK